ncbi:hypothetical protein CKM354_000515200 [Cercospora kikuchii]|uniref:Major facilitator superfamily (MFS) profile domain-containing protein n=1 Tax=Cercospora kikuchii TaxID=84275 RepID=A0A9P3CNZ5_9PEZI|nr:uncharacterized protein CKM354_000515200 [Cercospora kikuchii]GIZ41863.1 hypothetical protein CKM354_000515200 [Cercospora kikuchii]
MGWVSRIFSTGEEGSNRKLNAYNIWMLLFVSIGSMVYGYTASIIGSTLGQPTFIAYFQLATRPNGTQLIAATNGLFQAGGVIGTLTLPLFTDRWGRKAGLGVSALLALISGAALAGSTHIIVFLIFRFIAGASAFMILAAVPIWMSEVVPPYLRGALVNVHAISLVFGYFIQAWIGFGFFHWKEGGNWTWRVPILFQCVWPLMLLSGLYWVPESPRWLCMKDRGEEAKNILFRLHDDPSDPSHSFARAEYVQIQKQLTLDRTLDDSWMHIFRKPSLRKRLWLTIGTTGFIQCSGVLVINNYGPTLYRNLGFSETKQLLYPAAWLTLAVGLNAMASLLVDHFNRAKFLAIGVFGCMVTLIIEAALIAEFVPSNNSAALQAAVAMLFSFEIPYDWCLDGLQFTYISEIWPSHLRAKGMSAGVAMISLMNIMWLQAAPTAFETIGWKFYLCFIIPGTIGSVIMWFCFPDTKGKPLEEVAAIFGDVDEVAVYQRDIDISIDDKSGEKERNVVYVEETGVHKA